MDYTIIKRVLNELLIQVISYHLINYFSIILQGVFMVCNKALNITPSTK